VPPALVDSAVEELNRVPLAELRPLAEELGIIGEWGRHLDSPPTSCEWKEALRLIVGKYLTFEPIDGDKQFEEAVRNRKFFESAIGWMIAKSAPARQLLSEQYQVLSKRIARIRADEHGRLSGEDSELAWRLDAKFHRLCCQAAECPHFGDIVSKVWKKYRDTGRPRTAAELEKTWREHDQIVDAILTARPDDVASRQRIYHAIFEHVDKACSRWQANQGRGMEALDAKLHKFFGKPMPEDIRAGQQAFAQELPALLESHEGQWVLYVGQHRRGFFPSQAQAYELCSQLQVKRNAFIVRQVLPPDEDLTCGLGS
jgi:hypothetical protein